MAAAIAADCKMHGVLLETPADGSQWIAIVVAILSIIYIAFVRPLRKNKKDPLARKPGDAALAQQRAAERDMTSLLLEYEQMMRTMSSQVETRVAKLELLLRDADERIGVLKQLAAGTSTETLAIPQARSSVGSNAATSAADLLPLLAESEAPPHRDVYALADQGLSYREIARRLDRPNGEIELILALRSSSAALMPTQDPAAGPGRPSSGDVEPADEFPGKTSDEDVRREGELVLSAAAGPGGAVAVAACSHGDDRPGRTDETHRRHRKKRR